MDYIEIWKEVIQSPSDFYRGMSTTGGYADPLTFAAISFAISGILSALLSFGISGIFGMHGRGFSFLTLIGFVVATPILGIIGLLIGAAILYIIYKILGGNGKLRRYCKIRVLCNCRAGTFLDSSCRPDSLGLRNISHYCGWLVCT